MTFTKRSDGRKLDELRPIEAKVGVIPNADGSAYFKIGNTTAYAAVYGPRDLYPKFLQNPKEGVLRCYYNMMPFSGAGDRVRPGGNRRSKEISLVTENALGPVIDLVQFPNAVVDVFIEFPQTDAGSRCAGICAASMALADAGFVMKDLVCAIAVGKVGDKFLLDLSYEEESLKEEEVSDIPVAMHLRDNKISLLQMDGTLKPADLKKALELARVGCKKIYEVQTQALKAKYEVELQ